MIDACTRVAAGRGKVEYVCLLYNERMQQSITFQLQSDTHTTLCIHRIPWPEYWPVHADKAATQHHKRSKICIFLAHYPITEATVPHPYSIENAARYPCCLCCYMQCSCSTRAACDSTCTNRCVLLPCTWLCLLLHLLHCIS